VKGTRPSQRTLALALYAILTLLSFPHELPGGLVFDLGFVLVWFGPAALAIGLEGLSPGRAARAAFIASLAGHTVLFYWFYVVTVLYGGMPAFLGLLSPLVPALYVSVFSALFAWLWTRHGGIEHGSAFAGAILWVAVDWARGHFMGGFPWATLGYALHLDTPLLAWTRWTGVYGLSFVAALVGLALARIWWVGQQGAVRRLAFVACGLAFAHAVGLAIAPPDLESAETVRIAAVQGNIDQGQKWDADRRERILDTYLRLSAEAVEEGAEWIVWPETAVPGLVEADSALRTKIGLLASRSGVSLIVGGTGVEFDASSRRFSAFMDSAFVFDSGGVVRDRYDKTHLVPFGEFVPLRGLFGRFFKSLARGLSPTDITAGAAPRALVIESSLPGAEPLRVGIPICYELLFPHVVRQFGADGAGVMLAITNDAWYGRTGAPHQFLAMTTLRAAENGRWVVRAANTGISAMIDAHGRVRQSSKLFEESIVVADVPVSTSLAPTFYARFGDVFAGFCVLGSVALVGSLIFGERGRKT
jgi:apolipoprotein N-acyltransferase